MTSYRCPECGFTYREAQGNAHEGYAPGTPWSQVPEDWPCPDCGVESKVDFVLADDEKAQ